MEAITRNQELSESGMRCTDAAALAFGATTVEAHDALEVANAIGRGFQPVLFDGTLGAFIADHSTGDFLIVTAGHCMALRAGILTDTALAGPRRRVIVALRIL
jgi:hypothetical protein